MDQLSNEKILREAGAPGSAVYFVLTTHRVRLTKQSAGQGDIVSIMLDQVASCALTKRSRPIFLVLAAVALLAGLALAARGESGGSAAGAIVIAIFLALIYYLGMQKVLELGSAHAAIRMNVKSMRIEAIEDLIDAVERAKNDRYFRRSGVDAGLQRNHRPYA